MNLLIAYRGHVMVPLFLGCLLTESRAAALLGGRDGAGGMPCCISNQSQIPARVQEVTELRDVLWFLVC